MTDKEKLTVKKECKKFILRDENLSKNFNACTEEDQEWVLNYLSLGKGTILYEMITRYDSLGISPEEDNFFLPHHFYSSLKDNIMTKEEYDNVKKFYLTLKLKDLDELNKICNFRTRLFYVKYSSRDLNICKNYLNLTQENVIRQVHLVVACIGIKASV